MVASHTKVEEEEPAADQAISEFSRKNEQMILVIFSSLSGNGVKL